MAFLLFVLESPEADRQVSHALKISERQ
uniref:Uncharacterized protein n=1 Tax=Anguilla anguilla TaxID=7936 RepID=A0A0E9UG79_ANGAN